MPVYRADLPRTLTLVVALLLIAMAPTSIIAREFRVTDNRSEDDPTVEKLRFVGRLVAERAPEPRLGVGHGRLQALIGPLHVHARRLDLVVAQHARDRLGLPRVQLVHYGKLTA